MQEGRSKYPFENVATPIREDQLVIAPSLQVGAFDSHAVDCPFVFSKDGRQGMTYIGWDGVGYQTALTWNDGNDNWSPGTLIFRRDPNNELRKYNAALTSIVRDNDINSLGELILINGWYYGTFHAYPSPGYEAGAGAIGFVKSRDLLNWVEVGSTLRAEEGMPWEQGGLYKSWLLHHDGLFYLYYNAKNLDVFGSTQVPPPWIEQTGLATSPDLVHWQRYAGNPILAAGGPGEFDEVFASDPCVLRDGVDWIMFYFGLAADGHAREGFATSRDLIYWGKSGRVLLDVGPPGSIDSIHTHKPAVISRHDRLEHYYCAVAPVAGIDVAGYTQRELRGIARASSAARHSSSNRLERAAPRIFPTLPTSRS